MPALATSTSTGPCSASTAVNAASTSAAEVTSQRTPNRSSGTALPRCVMATLSPLPAKARATASPMPRLPPVTRTDRLMRRGSIHASHASGSAGTPCRTGLPAGTVRRMRAIQITEFGGPETLVVSELPDPVAGDGQQVFDVLAAGINYADTHQTEDSYLAKQTPAVHPRRRGRRPRQRRPAAGRPARPAAVTPRRSPPIPGGCSRCPTRCPTRPR